MGKRPTVASGIERSLMEWRGPSQPGHSSALVNRRAQRYKRPASVPDQAGEPPQFHHELELLGTVDLHHRHPQPVRTLELVVPVDEDLLEVEPGSLPLAQDHRTSLVAEMTGRARVHDHPMAGHS